MKKRRLGRDGPMVSAIGLGCMSFAGFFGATTEAESHRCLDAAVDRGIDFLDTANVYGDGVSETVIGTWGGLKTGKVRIATKAGIRRGDGPDNSEPHLRAELDGSFRRLGVDRVELFYVHRREKGRPVEEVAETMGRLIAEGKIGGWGLSEVSPATLRRAHAVCPVRAVQSEYSLWTRLPELGMLQATAELGVAFVPFSPVARGMLGRSYPDPKTMAATDYRQTIPRFAEPAYSANCRAIDGLRGFAASRGWAVSALALAWILSRGDHLIPIPGTRSADHLRDWAGADTLPLTAGDLAEINCILPPGFAEGDRYGDENALNVERYC
jgi:aryl-alcohol dehydrogenase-like predicted oxidoreductase